MAPQSIYPSMFLALLLALFLCPASAVAAQSPAAPAATTSAKSSDPAAASPNAGPLQAVGNTLRRYPSRPRRQSAGWVHGAALRHYHRPRTGWCAVPVPSKLRRQARSLGAARHRQSLLAGQEMTPHCLPPRIATPLCETSNQIRENSPTAPRTTQHATSDRRPAARPSGAHL